MTARRGMDETPLSDFLLKMRDAHRRRLAAVTITEKRAIEREMHGLIVDAGRDADAATAEEPAVEKGVQRRVPRATRRRAHARPGGPSKYRRNGFDHKLAQSGEREGDDD